MARHPTKNDAVLERVKETTECCICTDSFSDPRMLPCMHTFCLKCLDQTALLGNKKPGDGLPCPVCRNSFTIPWNGISGLPKNFFIERLLGILATSDQVEVFCGVCISQGDELLEKPRALSFCVNCCENFCEACCQAHEAEKLYESHLIVPIDSQIHKEHLSGMACVPDRYCREHADELLKYFCFNCRMLNCRACFITSHQGHRCVHVVKAAVELNEGVEKEIHELYACDEECSERHLLVSQEASLFELDVEDIKKRIRDRNAELKMLIDVHTEKLLQQLNSVKSDKLQSAKSEMTELSGFWESTKCFMKKYSSLKQSTLDFCSLVDGLQAEASELKKSASLKANSVTALGKLFLKKTKIENFLSGDDNLIGQIEAFPIFQRRRLELNDYSLFGVTELQNNIFVLSRSPKVILVFQGFSPYGLVQEIKIDIMEEPNDIAGCCRENCLYVVDGGSNCVFMVSPNSYTTTCWLMVGKYIGSLAVTDKGHVIVTRKGKQSNLTVYESDGTVAISSILLEDELSNCLHVVQKVNGNFVLSYGSGMLFGVVEVNGDGQIVQRFSSDDETIWLKYPCHLALISDDKIAIANLYNHQVMLLHPGLSCDRVLISKERHDILFPWRLCYAGRSRHLLVVHGGKKVTGERRTLDIYSLDDST